MKWTFTNFNEFKKNWYNSWTHGPVASTRVQGWGDEPCEPTVRLPDWSELVASYSRMKSAWGCANGGQPTLVCYIRKYVIILGGYSRWRPPNQNIGDVSRHPRRGWRQCHGRSRNDVSLRRTTQWRHSLRRQRVPLCDPVCANMTSSVKLELRNISQRRQR